MSLFQELKRRNVFRVGAAYAVAAWIILQITDVVGEIMELPPWGGKLILLIVLAGFPLSLLLAWAFELTPEGVRRESEVERQASMTGQTGKRLDQVIIVLLVIALGYFVWESRFSGRVEAPAGTPAQSVAGEAMTPPAADATPEATTRAADVPPTLDPRSIAVLPFDNRSRLQDDEFFVQGVHDDLLTNLARIGDLKVISRTSVTRYARSDKSIPEIARELNVATVMEGAVQRSGNMVRINVQLIDARTDEHLWAEIFDRTLTADNLFAIQTEISERIAGALETELSADESARLVDRPTEDLEAYTAYLRGRQLLVNRRSDELEQALAEFRRATALDPKFALAWVGVSEAAGLLSSYGTLDFADSISIREDAVDRALALDPNLGEAHLALAILRDARGLDPDEEYRRALELSPGNATAHQWYAEHLRQRPSGLPRAVEHLRQALEIDPLSAIVRRELAATLTRQGRYAEAQRTLDRLFELDPDFVPAFTTQADLYSYQGRFDRQIEWLLRASALDPDNFASYYPMVWAFLDLEDQQAIQRLREHMLTRVDEDHLNIAWLDVMAAMGNDGPDAALEHITWIYDRMDQLPFVKSIEAYLHVQRDDAARARAAFEAYDPRLFDPGRWENAIADHPRDACMAGWMMMGTGEASRGRTLVDEAVRYLEEELPRYVDNDYVWGIEECYMIQGDLEAVLDTLETRLEHRDLFGWHFHDKIPYYAPLVRDPRYQSLDRQRRAILAKQREAIAELGFGGAGP